MDPIFINRFKHTNEMYIETNKTYSKISRIILSLSILIVYSALAIFFITYYYEPLTAIVLALVGIVFSFYPTLRFYIFARKREKQLLELYDTLPECETTFYEDHLTSISLTSKEELNLNYQKIKKVKQSKNLYLLVLGNKIVVMVDKNKFEKGTCEEFENFIKIKAINAKIKL